MWLRGIVSATSNMSGNYPCLILTAKQKANTTLCPISSVLVKINPKKSNFLQSTKVGCMKVPCFCHHRMDEQISSSKQRKNINYVKLLLWIDFKRQQMIRPDDQEVKKDQPAFIMVMDLTPNVFCTTLKKQNRMYTPTAFIQDAVKYGKRKAVLSRNRHAAEEIRGYKFQSKKTAQ